jgi:hypothetical protein
VLADCPSPLPLTSVSGSGLRDLVIPSSVEALGRNCFYYCTSLLSVPFESLSRLERIEANAFSDSGLMCIVIPSSAEIFGDGCFSNCKQLQSITFEGGSRLHQIGQNIFQGSAISPVLALTTF